MAYKKQATFKEYTIGVRENNSIEVLVNGKPYDGAVKPLLRDIAQNVGLSVEEKWNTQDLGRKLVDIVNNKETKMGKPTSNKNNKEKSPAILINIMYSGSYLKENLGHEVINLIATDKGKHYIYINPIGKIGKDAIKKYNIEYILLGQLIDAQTVKVIAKASGIEMLRSTKKTLNNSNAKEGKIGDREYQDHTDEMRSATYGGISVVDFFPNEKQLLATYSAEKVVEASKELFLRYEKDRFNEKYKGEDPAGESVIFLPDTTHPEGKEKYQFSRQNPYMYFPQINGKDETDYDIIDKIIKNEKYWKKECVGKFYYDKHKRTYELPIEIMKKEDWELAYSNMISYYLRNNTSTAENFIVFLRRKNQEIPAPNTKNSHIEIIREYKNIDILIRYDETAIIIENKIKADVSLYDEKDGKKDISQLEKYIRVMNEGNDEEYKNKYFFLLQPDYRKINPDKYLSDGNKGKYKILNYSDLFDFFNKDNHECISDVLINKEAVNFKFFKESLELHKEKIDNRNFNTMMRRLGKRIKDIKEHK